MKILQLDTYCHHKNEIGFRLMCESVGAELVKTKDPALFSKEWDFVFLPSQYIPPEQFPNAKCIMYGPHNFVFVNGIWQSGTRLFPPHCFYNLLSDWIIELQKEFGGLSMSSVTIPFAVDIQSFVPSNQEKTLDCFIYLKNRDPTLFENLRPFLDSKNIHFKIIEYGKYKEEDYKKILKEVKFGVWIGSHESQGFALQEALATNVPLVVYDAKTMFDEYNTNGKFTYDEHRGKYSLFATTCPYWSDECGKKTTNFEELCSCILFMKSNFQNYNPREFIERELSPEVCMRRLLEVCRSKAEDKSL